MSAHEITDPAASPKSTGSRPRHSTDASKPTTASAQAPGLEGRRRVPGMEGRPGETGAVFPAMRYRDLVTPAGTINRAAVRQVAARRAEHERALEIVVLSRMPVPRWANGEAREEITRLAATVDPATLPGLRSVAAVRRAMRRDVLEIASAMVRAAGAVPAIGRTRIPEFA
jgi:hypothetical protein